MANGGNANGELSKVSNGDLIFGGVDPMTRGEIDTQVSTAKSYPRSITRFKETALALATDTEEIAASCHYSVPRGGKDIQGPSIRLAEIVYYAWGNLRVSATIIEESATYVHVRGACWDLETNNAVSRDVRRSIVGRNGRFTPDMITVTVNAAMAIAIRNAIFTAVPRSFVNSIYEKAYQVAFGNASTFKATLSKMVEHYAKIGVGQDRLLTYLEKGGVDDITMDDVAHLRGVFNSIKDGATTIDEAFPVEKPEPKDDGGKSKKKKTKTEEMAERFSGSKTEKADESVGTPNDVAFSIMDSVQIADSDERLNELTEEVNLLVEDGSLDKDKGTELINFIEARRKEIGGK